MGFGLKDYLDDGLSDICGEGCDLGSECEVDDLASPKESD